MIRRFGKFSLVGMLGAALQLVLISQLARHMGSVAATAIAIEIVPLHNFLWHERFTWRNREAGRLWQRAARWWRFQMGNGLISLAGNSTLIYFLVDRLKAPVLPSALLGIAICAAANFLLAGRWVYRQRGAGC